jgi:hypothetical protein
MFERRALLVSLVLAAVILPFCGGNAQSAGSSESHFLRPCGDGCKGGFECVCGVCTEPCTAGTSCGDLGVASSVCAAGASQASCSESICDVLCDSGGDCAAMGGDFECQGGRCRAQVACGAGKCHLEGGAAPTCDEREAEASTAVTAAVEAADHKCLIDADCVEVSTSSGCHESCGAIISKVGAPSVASTIEGLDTGLCATFEADGCHKIVPPCDPPGTPACIGQKCTAGYCGDGACTSGESAANCPLDCICGDGACTAGETVASCPGDCTRCGDGSCTGAESAARCPEDCGSCGDQKCNNGEDVRSCPTDCPGQLP